MVKGDAEPLGCARWRGRSSVPAAWSAGKSPSIQRKTLAGCPFEHGVRAIVAKEREWLWAEER
ncbi:hypothetical protein [Paenibacillus eucommiae]|uniref:Uncharacterized protein n=1 Tax=Paenibacillus eucommiae TaxID=1355755 RepID=A0ABS4ISV0_9BACL|nr:hypothetical protein [Paenibacillus eucommiae]MBP1990654.1 hypothetical protein [Paenibacillus eucommiae]